MLLAPIPLVQLLHMVFHIGIGVVGATIEDSLRIQQEGRAKRQAAEQELVAIEGKLRDTLLAHIGRQL